MYKYMLPYDSHTDRSGLQAHNDANSSVHNHPAQGSRRYPLTRAIRTGTHRVRTALRRSLRRSPDRSMGWWH